MAIYWSLEMLGTCDNTDDVNIPRVSAWEKGGPNNRKGKACIHLCILGPQSYHAFSQLLLCI